MNRKEKILARQREIMTAARCEERDLTAEEKVEFDNLQRELENLGGTTGEDEGEGSRGMERPAEGDSPEEIAQRAIAKERKRVAEITSLCRGFDMEANGYINSGKTVEEVRDLVLKELERTHQPINARVTLDEEDKFRASVSDGLLMRAGVQQNEYAPGAGDFRNMRLRDLAAQCLARDGGDVTELLRMSPDDMYATLCREFYNPTAAFPAILDNTIKKSIVTIYNQVPTTYQAWVTKGSLSDFKETSDHEYVIGGMGDFEEVPENGEIKADKPRTELLPTRRLKTYGKQFSMTRQAFINDDIGFLTRIPGLYATKAKQTIDKQVYTLLYNNDKIFDGKVLFGKEHNNLMAAGSKPTQVSIQSIILQMQKQKDQFGDAIYVTPRYIIVPVGYEFDLAVILHSTQVTGSANNDINPLYNYPLQIVQTPVLNALAGNNEVPWFMVADQLSARSVHVDYLNGQETPIVRRMEAPGTLGFTWDIYTDWGISIRDFRGIAKNPGEKII